MLGHALYFYIVYARYGPHYQEFDNRLIYDIPQESVKPLSDIFTSFENAKNRSKNTVQSNNFRTSIQSCR
jgi:hypothetical protein